MRPRYLEIEGLQSFKELQRIDFDKLGETGLFGIFGPTGSGKSTVLDGITLAMYGNVQRATRGTQGIIHTDLDTVRASFTFDLKKGSTRKTYRVERLYRRKKDTPNFCEARMARLFEIQGDEEEILADKPTEVSAKVEELIGLGLDDFTRSVVLPQNRFQEFLLLEKSKKREMLERIFYLEEYGKQLSEKVSRKLSAVRYSLSNIQGALSTLGDASEKALIEAEARMRSSKENRDRVDKELKALEIRFYEAKELWELINELKTLEKKEALHLESLEDIKQKERLYESSKKAEEIMGIISNYKENTKNLMETQSQLEQLEILLPKLEQELAAARLHYEERIKEAEKERPRLIERKARLNDALSLKDEVEALNRRLASQRQSYVELKRSLGDKEREIQLGKNELAQIEQNSADYKGKVEKLKVDIDYRKEIQQGATLEDEVQNAQKKFDEDQTKYKETADIVRQLEVEAQSSIEKKMAIEKQLKEANLHQTEHEALKPGERNSIIEENNELHRLYSLNKTLISAREDLNSIEKRRGDIQEQILGLADDYRKQEENKNNLEKKLEESRKEIESLQKQLEMNASFILAQKLVLGDPCPVCGSTHHPAPAHHQFGDGEMEEIENSLKEARHRLTQNEQFFREAENVCIKLDERRKGLESQDNILEQELHLKREEFHGHYDSLPKELKVLSLEDIDPALKGMMEANNEKMRVLEVWEAKREEFRVGAAELNKSLSECGMDERQKGTELRIRKESLEQLRSALEEDRKALDERLNVYKSFIEKMGLQSVRNELANIEARDRQGVLLQNKILELSQKEAILRKSLEQLNTEAQGLSNSLAEVEADGRNLKEQKDDKENKIRILTGAQEIQAGLKEVDDKLLFLAREEEQLSQGVKTLENRYNQENIKKSTLERQRDIYSRNLKVEEERLQLSLKNKGFKNIQEAEDAVLSKENQEKLDEEIRLYKETQESLKTQKSFLNNKLKGREMNETDWQKICESYETKKQEEKDSIGKYETAKSSYANIKENFKNWMKLNQEKKEQERKQEMLGQIQKLLKANAFVEFICEERLRYIAKEASDILDILTKYRYALELDTENGFVIRDNANGGVCRLVSSLSGGETFLTSLSLALALSKQIQLKGQSPLEFFFLDEGFGTLDNSLLDAVIDSLERLSTKDRVIGLISHVPELKARISRRLIVEPPTTDGRGTRVYIEKS